MAMIGAVPADAIGLKLYRITGERLIGCETAIFQNGAAAVETTLLRASLSGRVEVGGDVQNHFADIYVNGHTWSETVALDAKSYRALKTRWMRCKTEPDL